MKPKDLRKIYGKTTVKQRSTCPTHGEGMIARDTNYGTLWVCEIKNCDVICWENPTSLPGTKADIAARRLAHKVFDELWQSGKTTRGRAYNMLAEFLNLPRTRTHIGMFNEAMCHKVFAFVDNFLKGKIR